MKRILHYSLITAVLSYWSFIQASVLLLNDYPKQYTVQRGDTLWDIASVFLAKPWHWPAIWQVNTQIDNPHLIYPGDQLSLVYTAGKPQLILARETVRLSPSMRTLTVAEPIPSIPSVSLKAFYERGQIVSVKTAESAARVLRLSDRRLMNTETDQVMLVGKLTHNSQDYALYRPIHTLIDPQSEEVLGIQMDFVASIDQLEATDTLNVFSAVLKESLRETRVGDRVLLKSTFESTALRPQQSTITNKGQIISTASHRRFIVQHDSVTINRGTREQVNAGDVLIVSQKATSIYDPIERKKYALAGKETGVMMVYQAFEKASYGMIMEADLPIKLLDNVAVTK